MCARSELPLTHGSPPFVFVYSIQSSIDLLILKSLYLQTLYFTHSIGLQLPIVLLLRCGDSLQDCPRKLKRVAVSFLLEGSEKWSHVYAALHETPGVLL